MAKRPPARLNREISSALEIKPPRLKRLGYINGLAIYLVSGEQVRNTLDLDFTAGGNFGAYPGYVPKNEIWLDDALHVFDRIATIFHEIVELHLMINRGMDYDGAHEIACERELKFREKLAKNPPKSTDLRLVAKELKPYAAEATPTGKKVGKASRTQTSNW